MSLSSVPAGAKGIQKAASAEELRMLREVVRNLAADAAQALVELEM
jgi:hypothetical protein